MQEHLRVALHHAGEQVGHHAEHVVQRQEAQHALAAQVLCRHAAALLLLHEGDGLQAYCPAIIHIYPAGIRGARGTQGHAVRPLGLEALAEHAVGQIAGGALGVFRQAVPVAARHQGGGSGLGHQMAHRAVVQGGVQQQGLASRGQQRPEQDGPGHLGLHAQAHPAVGTAQGGVLDAGGGLEHAGAEFLIGHLLLAVLFQPDHGGSVALAAQYVKKVFKAQVLPKQFAFLIPGQSHE